MAEKSHWIFRCCSIDPPQPLLCENINKMQAHLMLTVYIDWTKLYNKIRLPMNIHTMRNFSDSRHILFNIRRFIEVRSPMKEQRMESHGTIRQLMFLNLPLNIKNVEKLLCWLNEKHPHSLICLDTSCLRPGNLAVGFETLRKLCRRKSVTRMGWI